MFWGLIMEPQRRYTQIVKKSFHISMAALDISTSNNDPAQVMCGFEGRNYLLCTLQKPDKVQCPLDLNYEVGTEVSFATNGRCHVHLTGYLTDDVLQGIEEEQEEEDDDQEIKEENEVSAIKSGKRQNRLENGPPAKRAKPDKQIVSSSQPANEDDDDSDDSDVDMSKLLLEESDDEEEEDEEEESTDDEEENEVNDERGEEEEDDDEEEEEDELSDLSDEEEELKPKVQPMKEKSKLNGDIKNQKQKQATVSPNKQKQKQPEVKTPKSEKKQKANKFENTNAVQKTPGKDQKNVQNKENKQGRTPGKEQLKTPGKEQLKTPGKEQFKTPGKEQKSPGKDQNKTPGGKDQNRTPGKSPKKRTVTGGVIIEDIVEGSGDAVAKPGKYVHVYYEGKLRDSHKTFDATSKGPGFGFRLGKGDVIKGWDVGIAGMKIGGKRRITCPPGMAYGQKGCLPEIPGNATLTFDIELKKIS